MKAVERFASWSPYILGIFRILAGVMFACHGAQKVIGAFGGLPPGAAEMWTVRIAGPIEFFGGALIALGLFTRPVAFLCSGLMAVAYFYGHAGNNSFWPKVNGGELAVLYCWIFLYLAAQGPGAFALDQLFRRRTAVATA
jgi:putative oxidoreductase